ncbi:MULTISPECIES: flagellar motor protein MotS [Virgibacillus]|uniref:Flagellar motor protein MotB n=2 Tax=Virgibacillus TaxID=84406 RepID=A0A941IDC3_9BACI|nr:MULTISPECIES: flagellar motor protein MotS [Virgibacillus]MBR7798257.1 flagellar motor protein MotB [Virgibacillus salarius]NAZ10965.1 flagellar motor protein MotB [Agaribacter marinus]QRZ17730.1 flagellar motor protein MotB [Virgibacillus sp. AGTR]
MKRRQIRRSNKNGAPKWMVTYSDMVTLILVFFILLFSMSQIDLVKFEAISDSFRNRMIFDFYPSPVPMDNPTENTSNEESGEQSNEFDTPTQMPNTNDRDKQTDKNEQSLDDLMKEVEAYLDKNDLNKVISANRTKQGVELVLQESILFDSGEAVILNSGKPFLNKIGSLLKNLPNHVHVEGHTDSRPISNYRYPSNWELSGARASSVIRYLLQQNDFDRSRFSSVGYADTQPIAPNTSAVNWSKNRRVEIVILERNQSPVEGAGT